MMAERIFVLVRNVLAVSRFSLDETVLLSSKNI